MTILDSTGKPYHRNVQMSGDERFCVLVHKDTKRILCFCRDDHFASTFTGKGYVKHEINHAADYDRWSKRLREQKINEDAADDLQKLERESAVRKVLREQLKKRLAAEPTAAGKQAVASALGCLDWMEEKKKRYRKESFQFNEAYEAGTNAEDVVVDLMTKQ